MDVNHKTATFGYLGALLYQGAEESERMSTTDRTEIQGRKRYPGGR